MTDEDLNTPCRHLRSRVTCVPCLNDEVEATALLATLDEGGEDCPALSDTGLRCHKRRTHLSDDSWEHAGGHMYMSDETAAGFAAGHYDARKVLSGEPFSLHDPSECPGPPECFGGAA